MKKVETTEKSEFSNIFPKRLKEVREERGLTQKEISLRIGTSANAINNYELGLRTPTADILRKIAISLNVSADYLLGFSDNSKKINSEIYFEDIADAIIKIFSLKKVQCNPSGQLIEVGDENLSDFIAEFLKIRDFIDSPNYPDYLKEGLKKALIQRFSEKFCVTNRIINFTTEYIDEVFSKAFDEPEQGENS